MKITNNNLTDVFKSPRCSVKTMELKGYELIDNIFVDSSGFGSPDEPAYTVSQLITELRKILRNNLIVYTSLTNVGQFQVYVGIFKKTKNKVARKIANNTLEILKDGKRIIRFHDTDILTFHNNTVVLDNGEYQTATTKDRMNTYLPSGFSISQKNFLWYVTNPEGIKAPYINGMTLTVNL